MFRSPFATPIGCRIGAALLAMQFFASSAHGQAVSSVARSVAPNDYDAILAQEGYIRPPEMIERAVLAPRHLQVSLSNLSPNGRQFLTTQTLQMPTIADWGKPHYNLAGWFVDAAANRSRSLTTSTNIGLQLVSLSDGRTVTVQVPAGARVTNPRWSPDGQQVAFLANTEKETQIWVADVSNGRSRQVTRTPLLATHVTTFQWLPDGEHVVAVLVPPAASRPDISNNAIQPKVRMAQDAENRLRVYASLLETPHDMALVEHYSTGQLAKVNVGNGRVTNIGQPAMIRSVDASPDGQYFRVSLLQKPFSYIVPLGNFANAEQVWGADGKSLAQIASQPLREGVAAPGGGAGGGAAGGGQGAAPTKRSISWRPDGVGMTYLLRDRAPRAGEEGPRMDRLYNWVPPFTDESVEVVYETANEINQVRYSDDSQMLFITETAEGWQTTFAMPRGDASTKYQITRTRAPAGGGRGGGAAPAPAPAPTPDAGQNQGPTGTLMMMTASNLLSVVRTSTDGQFVYLTGTDRAEAAPADDGPQEEQEPPRPYIDRLNFRTGDLTRIFDGNVDYTESIATVIDRDVTQIVLSRQTQTMVPQSVFRNLTSNEERVLTRNADFTPEAMRNVQVLSFEAERSDGLQVRVRVTLPPDFRAGAKLPAFFWFYPREYTSFEAYYRTSRGPNGQVTPAYPPGPGRYPTFGPSAVQFFTMLGYAVIEPDIPIIGPEGRMNDNYVQDLRNSFAAVIDELDRRGIADRDRLALGGHSYGGFGTINAMVHTPFFKAGIAGAPQTNRLLTPLGFQSEQRTLWEARETYLSMSPFLYANQLSGALLMYHGMADQNVGTNPINSERMFHALNGLGKTSAYYRYPFEDHGQVTEESRLDMWARWAAWLDKYVKNGGKPAASLATDANDGAQGREGP